MRQPQRSIVSARTIATPGSRFAERIRQKHRPSVSYARRAQLTHKEDRGGLALYLEAIATLLSQVKQTASAPVSLRQTVYQDLRRYAQTVIHLPSGTTGGALQATLRALAQAPSPPDPAAIDRAMRQTSEALARLQAEKKTADSHNALVLTLDAKQSTTSQTISEYRGGLSRPTRSAERKRRIVGSDKPPFLLVAVPQPPAPKKQPARALRWERAFARLRRRISLATSPPDIHAAWKRLLAREPDRQKRRAQLRILSFLLPAPLAPPASASATAAQTALRRNLPSADVAAVYGGAKRATPAEGFFYFGSRYTLLPHMSLSLPVENAAVYQVPPEHPLFSSIQRHAEQTLQSRSAAAFLQSFLRRAVQPRFSAARYNQTYWQRIAAKLEPVLRRNWTLRQGGAAALPSPAALLQKQQPLWPQLLFLLTDPQKNRFTAAWRASEKIAALRPWLPQAAPAQWLYPLLQSETVRKPVALPSALFTLPDREPYLVLLTPQNARLRVAEANDPREALPLRQRPRQSLAFAAAVSERNGKTPAPPLSALRAAQSRGPTARAFSQATVKPQAIVPTTAVRKQAIAYASPAPRKRMRFPASPPAAETTARAVHLQPFSEPTEQLQVWIEKAAANCAAETEKRLKAAFSKEKNVAPSAALSHSDKAPVSPPPVDTNALYAKLYERLERELRNERRRVGL